MGNEKFMIRIRELRDSKNLSQEALAEKVGVSKSGVAMWETKGVVPRKETLEKIINHTGKMFGQSRKECGNYRNLSLEASKEECRAYLAVLEAQTNMEFTYPE